MAIAIDHMGTAGADGTIIPAYPWLNKAVVLAILIGYCSVILVCSWRKAACLCP